MHRDELVKRPKPQTLVQYDPDNYYAQLGVSPLTSTKEIKAIIIRKQNEVKSRRRFQEGQRFSEEDGEFSQLQKIADALALPKKRAEYDRLHPQNELLTVQPGKHEDWLDRRYRIDFVSAWLLEELSQEQFLPSSESLQLWAPKGIEPELLEFLAHFVKKHQTDSETMESKLNLQDENTLEEQSLIPSELEMLIKENKEKHFDQRDDEESEKDS